jgi:triosephosphate isomerase
VAGESLAQRRRPQLGDRALPGARAGAAERAASHIAYEPVWAIGTGRTATPEIAQQVHTFVRERLAARFGAPAAEAIRIQYGGSVKPDNIAALLSQPDVDGALVGGASLDPASFWAIIRNGLTGETAR